MTFPLVIGAVGWLVGAGLAWAFVAAAVRPRWVPFVRLDDLALLAVCA